MSSTLQFMKSLVKTSYDNYQKSRSRGDDVDILVKIKKSEVLMESRCFNDSQLIAKRCKNLLGKIVYLINQGEEFNQDESTQLFFSITKLFQSSNKELRRMIYLCVKELRKEETIYILTSSISKDINSKDDLFRMNSIRVAPIIAQHTDPQNLQQIERYLKNSISDKNTAIGCASLLAGLQMMNQTNYQELIRKWQPDILEKLKTTNNTQYHALSLLHQIKQHDQVSFIKILQQLTSSSNLDNITTLQLIRFSNQVINNPNLDQSSLNILTDFIKKNIHKSSDMVSLEACRAYSQIKSLNNKEISQAISVLLLFLTNEHNSVIKFSALKTLNQLINSPLRANLLVNVLEIEELINDNNRSIATIAISLLLKISKDDQIEKLLDQILTYISEISDEFKQDVLKSIESLIKKDEKNMKEHKLIQSFLLKCLEQEGSVEFKKNVIRLISDCISIGDMSEQGLMGLMEFIEDCEHLELHIMILDLVEKEIGKNRMDGQKLIRFIWNRVSLEDTQVRSKAITTLAYIAIYQQQHLPQIDHLLHTLIHDQEDEIRDKALYYISHIHHQQPNNSYFYSDDQLFYAQLQAVEAILNNDIHTQINLDSIQINQNLHNNNLNHNIIPNVNFNNVISNNQCINNKENIKKINQVDPNMFQDHQLFCEYGNLIQIKNKIALTDNQFEFQVSVQKYIFENNMIFQFEIENCLQNTLLKNIRIECQLNCDNLQIQHTQTVLEAKEGEKQTLMLGLAIDPENKLIVTQINCFLKCEINEIVDKTIVSCYQEEYQLEDFEINLLDFMQNSQDEQLMNKQENQFEKEWQLFAGEVNESTLQLGYKTLEQAINGIIKHFNMSIVDNSHNLNVQQLKTNQHHQLKLKGLYLNKITVYILILIAFDQKMGCIVKIKVKSQDSILNNNLIDSLTV